MNGSSITKNARISTAKHTKSSYLKNLKQLDSQKALKNQTSDKNKNTHITKKPLIKR